MTSDERLHVAQEINDIMDDSEPGTHRDQAESPQTSIHIDSPSDNRIVTAGDYIEINIHLAEKAEAVDLIHLVSQIRESLHGAPRSE